MPRRALVSVYDKTGLPELGRALTDLGVDIVSTGSTAQVLRDADVSVTEVSQVTGFPEILDGRVKTLHPAVHAALLADRSRPAHLAALAEHDIEPIDLVVANLYPFAETVARLDAGEAETIEMIDIGGQAMVRAAAKNHAWVAVVVSPADYEPLLEHLRGEGGTSGDTRRQLAQKAFGAVAAYDADISTWLHRDQVFPPLLATVHHKAADLRYGENPHQRAAYYLPAGSPTGLGAARQLQGKLLSYNNLLDSDAAWGMASDFSQPCVVIVKHSNPAGLAVNESLSGAYTKALAGDPVSAFGAVVAVNAELDLDTAREIANVFTEVVLAPRFSSEALAVLVGKENLRLLEVPAGIPRQLDLRSVAGGLLVQDADVEAERPDDWTVPTAAKVDDALLAELRFAWQACKHVKSNAIVLTRDRAVVGVGAGQMSRVDSVRLAVEKSQGRCDGAVLASDAFFPFRDGPDLALEAGVAALIQPGGSVRDDEVVNACDERGIPMVLTGRRHFRH
ncbi:MAG: bifunctional phosphoribosylaminoimidazolecarboxamide formyltransferase/IMP cyclohydrolase [Actinomycetota bacterium]|jgi:phosphoribosylaminoimidazolecarboxamide formyltransferase/IMP cyclohydrolase|nr:bifunctional phosphoribosylaminoimidazolecarboxamide formyltransferase/IMP cyclohydrolase [Actinomycetota bacterium]